MSEEIDFTENEPKKARPGFLTVLCVLSFISIGIAALTGLINLVSGPLSTEAMLESRVAIMDQVSQLKSSGMGSLADLMEKIQGMSEDINNNFYFAGILNLLIVGVGLYGVIKMMRGFKMGFHVYIVYCLLSIGAMYAYVSPVNIPTFLVVANLVISGLFVFLYSRNLKWMQ